MQKRMRAILGVALWNRSRDCECTCGILHGYGFISCFDQTVQEDKKEFRKTPQIFSPEVASLSLSTLLCFGLLLKCFTVFSCKLFLTTQIWWKQICVHADRERWIFATKRAAIKWEKKPRFWSCIPRWVNIIRANADHENKRFGRFCFWFFSSTLPGFCFHICTCLFTVYRKYSSVSIFLYIIWANFAGQIILSVRNRVHKQITPTGHDI